MQPETLTIELTNSTAIRLLEDLESLNIIKIHRKQKKAASEDLAARLQGSISSAQADNMNRQLELMRKEWDRSI